MFINFGEQLYRIYFGYTKNDFIDKGERFETKTVGGLKHMFEPPLPDADKTEYITSCVLEVKSKTETDPKKMWEGLSVESASLHASDEFNKDTGRKVALTKVLNSFPGSDYKLFRQAVWEAYLNRSKRIATIEFPEPQTKAECDSLIEQINKLKETLA